MKTLAQTINEMSGAHTRRMLSDATKVSAPAGADWYGLAPKMRRASIKVNTTAQTITVSPEGEAQSDIIIGYQESGGKLTLTWPDNEVFTVEVTG